MESVEERAERIESLEARRGGSRGVESRALTRAGLPAVMFPVTDAGVIVSERGALNIADAYAAVRCLADSAASLPLHVYRRTTSGRVRDLGPTAELLDRPAPAVTTANLVGQLVAHLALFGESFLAIYRDAAGRPVQLGLLAPNLVSVELAGGVPTYSWADELGNSVRAGVESVIHVRGLSMDGLRGVSPVREAREALGLASSLATTGSAFFANGARPSGVLSIPQGPDAQESLQNLRDGWNASHQGPRNAGRTGFLIGEAKFTPVSMPLADAQWLGAMEHSTRQVCRIFRLPPWMLGADAGGSLTYSTVAEQARAFVTFSLRPWLVVIEQALAACEALFPRGSGLFARFELDALLRGAPQERATVYTAALDPATGWMSRGEVRALEDLPAEPPPRQKAA